MLRILLKTLCGFILPLALFLSSPSVASFLLLCLNGTNFLLNVPKHNSLNKMIMTLNCLKVKDVDSMSKFLKESDKSYDSQCNFPQFDK